MKNSGKKLKTILKLVKRKKKIILKHDWITLNTLFGLRFKKIIQFFVHVEYSKFLFVANAIVYAARSNTNEILHLQAIKFS